MNPYKRLFELVDRSSYLNTEVEEMERVSKKKAGDLYSRFSKAKAVLLPDLIWNKLQNTDSNELEVGDIQRAQEIANRYERDFKHALTSVKNDSYDPPLILQKKNGKFTLVGGNTRLMAAKVLGIRPKVLIVSQLNEDYFTSDLQQQGATFELFKNPDKGEYNEMKEASYVYLRGVLVGEDAYVSSEHCTDGESPVVHLDILRVLKEKGIINEYSTRFIQDDMIGKYFCFYIEQNDKITVSGSYSNAFMNGTKIDLTPYFEKIKKQMAWLNYSSSMSS